MTDTTRPQGPAVGQDRPIFVVGFQRSGTTLLQSLLGAHPRIAAPPETYFLSRVYHLRDYWGDLHTDLQLRRVVHEMLNPAVPLFAEAGFDEEQLFGQLARSDRTYRTIFETMMLDFAGRHGKRRWSEKTPGQPATDVWELFPEAQVVHIVRDPRDVVRSSASVPWEREGAPAIARRYVRFTLDNAMAGSARGPDHYLRVRYEDLCHDPNTTLRIVCSFLGEDYDPGMVMDPSRREATIAAVAAPWQRRALETVAPDAGRDAQRRLHPVTRARVTAIVAPLLGPYGYRAPRPVTRFAGTALNVLHSPLALAETGRAAARARRSARTPETLYEASQRFQEEQARHVTMAARPTQSYVTDGHRHDSSAVL